MNYLKNWSTLVVVLVLGMFMSSCDKESSVAGDANISKISNLNDSDLEVGVKYPLSAMSDEFIKEMQLEDYNPHARTVVYRVRYWSEYPGDCNIPHMTNPNTGYATSLEGYYIWTPHSSFNGMWTVEWVDDTGSCSSSIDDEVNYRYYKIDNGILTVLNEIKPLWGPWQPTVYGEVYTSDGGITWGGMTMNP